MNLKTLYNVVKVLQKNSIVNILQKYIKQEIKKL